jgi:hypothetical protein
MHPLHDYIAKQLADKLKDGRVVVWYDERSEFRPFVDEVRGGPRAASGPVPMLVAGAKASLAEYAGSLFELRALVEPLASGDKPDALVVYIPGLAHDAKASVLMELEKAGRTWKPELKQLAKNVLLQKYTLGMVDDMLPFDRKVSYEDLARSAAGNSGTEPPSILKSIFHDASGNDGLLTAWLATDARDAEIVSKEATRELTKLVKARLGLDLVPDSPPAKLRAIVLRFVLAGEFRLDLLCGPPSSLDGVSKPTTKDEEGAVRELARRLRTGHPDTYASFADRVEEELGLKNANLPPGSLGSIDTFRFEERELLRHAGDLIATGQFSTALEVVQVREHSFWLDRDVGRKAQWEATKRMAEVGALAAGVIAGADGTKESVNAWVDAYVGDRTGADGWYSLDLAQRRLESWVANLDEEPDVRALAAARRAYEGACGAMANGFVSALESAEWSVPEALHQVRVFPDVVAAQPKPTAYFLVDSMRFEMGVEFCQRLPTSSEVAMRPAIAALPSITPVGMAALLPAASSSFAVIERSGKLTAEIDGSFIPDLVGRRKFLAARVADVVDLTLEELLGSTSTKLSKKVAGAKLIVVRSQEIDVAGEAGLSFQARQVMDTVIDNVARAIKRLSAVGVEHSVVTADHGHLFFPADRDESMRIDAPGGQTVSLHRRCWIGRGGSTPPGCVRVSASDLGYASDLEFVFPKGLGVIKAGGDLAYHHGGMSLQELVIPVVTVRLAAPSSSNAQAPLLQLSGGPETITNRIFSLQLTLGGAEPSMFAEPRTVRPIIVSRGRQVGAIGMAVDVEVDRLTGSLELRPGVPVTVAMVLNDDGVEAVRVVVQDSATDAEMFRSAADIPVRLGVV